jgi:hypothetical protein
LIANWQLPIGDWRMSSGNIVFVSPIRVRQINGSQIRHAPIGNWQLAIGNDRSI